MKSIRNLITSALLVSVAASFSGTNAHADTYSWTNLQSDIAGIAAHLDRNLVNPWGMAVSPNGTIWVSDNGTGVSTLYHQNGTAVPLIVTIPTGNLNSPWGLALVEGDELWVGNFGDGLINVYDPNTGAFIETLMRADGTPLQFDGLWDMLSQPNGVFFTAGIADEEHGLFGLITEDQE